jgi:hypothetical protein
VAQDDASGLRYGGTGDPAQQVICISDESQVETGHHEAGTCGMHMRVNKSGRDKESMQIYACVRTRCIRVSADPHDPIVFEADCRWCRALSEPTPDDDLSTKEENSLVGHAQWTR